MTGMSSIPARIKETSSGYCSCAPAVAPVHFAPHLFFTKSDSSENHNSKVEETSSSYCPCAPAVAPVHFAPHLFFAKSDSSENHNSKFIENKPAQRSQSQPPLVPENFVKLHSLQNNLHPPLQQPEGRGDLCGPMNKGDVRPVFSFLPSSSGVSKSVCFSKIRTALYLFLSHGILRRSLRWNSHKFNSTTTTTYPVKSH